MQKLAIVIVGYKSLGDLPDCLGSLQKSSYPNFEIFFIENSCLDDSGDWTEKNHPEVRLIRLQKNTGFAGGNNYGFNLILQDGNFSHVMILNPDTVTDANCLSELMQGISDNEIRQPLILINESGKNTDLINTSGNILHYLGFSYVGSYRSSKSDCKLPQDIAIASGAAAIFPVKLLNEVGSFPESFFTYFEDTDLFWRARLLGYQIKLFPKALIWHKYSFKKNKMKYYFAERNRYFFILRNYGWRLLLLGLPMQILLEVPMIALSIIQGWFTSKIKANFHVLITIPSLLKERREIQQKRKLSDRQLAKYLSTSFSFGEADIPAVGLLNGFSKLYWKLIKILI